MSLVAVISRTPPIRMDDWVQVARWTPELAPPPVRVIKNPFTGRMTTVQPSPWEADIQVNGTLLGGIEPGAEFDDDGELRVYSHQGVEDLLRTVLETLASRLSAEVQWMPRDPTAPETPETAGRMRCSVRATAAALDRESTARPPDRSAQHWALRCMRSAQRGDARAHVNGRVRGDGHVHGSTFTAF